MIGLREDRQERGRGQRGHQRAAAIQEFVLGGDGDEGPHRQAVLQLWHTVFAPC